MSTARRSRRIARHATTGARRGRFGTLALVLAGLLGLGAGAGTGTALSALPSSSSPPVAADAALSGAISVGSDPVPSAEVTTAVTPTPSVAAEPAAEVPSPEELAAQADLAAGILSPAVPTSAGGELVIVPGSAPAPDLTATSVRSVRVEVESGLDIDGSAFAAMVMATLNDPRGWGAGGTLSFSRTDGPAQLRVVLASPALVDSLCAPLETNGTYSCGRNGHAVINHTRWVTGTSDFPDLTVYRQYVVNHEVGHLLGHGHVSCPGAGQLAPLMQQQTVSVGPCLPNAWPSPEGA